MTSTIPASLSSLLASGSGASQEEAWAAFLAATPLLIIIGSGILLQTKKQWDFVQPPEQRGTGTVPAIDFVPS